MAQAVVRTNVVDLIMNTSIPAVEKLASAKLVEVDLAAPVGIMGRQQGQERRLRVSVYATKTTSRVRVGVSGERANELPNERVNERTSEQTSEQNEKRRKNKKIKKKSLRLSDCKRSEQL